MLVLRGVYLAEASHGFFLGAGMVLGMRSIFVDVRILQHALNVACN